MSQDSKEGRGFNRATAAYKRNPTLESYIKLRRKNPSAKIEIGITGGIDQLFFMAGELRKFGFSTDLVASAMDAEPGAISELSLQVLERVAEAEALSKTGKSHLGRRGLKVPDKLINWLIACMLDSLSWNNSLYIPRDLIVLIRQRLGGAESEYQKVLRADEQRSKAIHIGGSLLAQGRQPSLRFIAKALRVAPSTVKRWFSKGEFAAEVELASAMFDSHGRLESPQELFEAMSRKK